MISEYDIELKIFFVLLVGPTKIPSINIPKEVGGSAWEVIRGSDVYHASSDASLFSSSLPVLPHEKCMCWLFLLKKLFVCSVHHKFIDVNSLICSELE